MNGTEGLTASRQGESRQEARWLVFLFLLLVFFSIHHDWRCSLSVENGYNKPQHEILTANEQGSTARRVAFLSLGILATAALLASGSWRLRVDGSLGWLILFFLSWAFLSLAWSANPALTLRKLGALAIMCLGALAVVQRFSMRDTILWVLVSTLVYLHVGVAVEIALGTFRPFSEGYRFAGTLHPNIQGINCALLFFASSFFLLTGKRRRYLLYAAAFESLLFLLLAKSRTSLVAAVLAVSLYWFLTLPSSRKRWVMLGAVLTACFFALLSDHIFPALEHAASLGRQQGLETITLTYRTLIWQQALSYIARRPVTGYGYDSFWTSDHIMAFSTRQGNPTPHAHSAYVDCILGLGIVGGAVFILITLVAVRRALAAYRHSRDMGYAFFGVVLIFAALDGLAESAFIQPSHLSFLAMAAMAALAFPASARRPGEGRRRLTGGAALPEVSRTGWNQPG